MSLVSELNAAPCNLDAERAVLGALLVNPSAFSVARDTISPGVFFNGQHGQLYEAIEAASFAGKDVTITSIHHELKRLGTFGPGLANLLADIMSSVHTAAGLETHCGILVEMHILRKLISTSTDVVNNSRMEGAVASDILDDAEKRLFEISRESFTGAGFARIGDIMGKAMPDVQSLMPDPSGARSGVMTGFARLDQFTTGFQRGHLVLIAGRPSMGKTSIAMNIVHVKSVRERIPTAVFSLEQSREELVTRMICGEASVDSQRLRRGRLRKGDLESLEIAMNEIKGAPLYIDDTGGISIKELRAKARMMRARHGVEMIVVDYLQLMTTGFRKGQNREQEVAQISGALKALAKELEIPVVALSQLSRAVEMRDDKRPRLSDLRESGALEQDSDVVIFLYRPEKYWEDDDTLRGCAEIIIAKQRNGPVGTVRATFQEGQTRFDELAFTKDDKERQGGFAW